ncbi:MAG: hypothetical protein J6O61_16050 [Butyrivibrio sp.]|uniref:hypothetical protein n=1 Tax=Butyrivibrio sp. TaxID=28121 RepID=UPI001B1DB7E8|nr:hypothetical protein [Butyrivibrio sp.]MBO6242316.1 hypothetical protein [Butyrivibrio sp.]
MNKRLRSIASMLMIAMLMLTGCGSASTVLDYGDAESFEAALNAGENLEGKTVRFYASELHPDSAMGYNVWAGEHLNFISSRNPDIKEGDIVDVKATEITSTMGSWFIKYEKIGDAVIGDNTITIGAKSSDTTDVAGSKEEATTQTDDSDKELKTSADLSEKAEKKETSATTDVKAELDKIEAVDAGIEVFDQSYGGKRVSAYMAIKNNSSINLRFSDMRFEYVDNDGNLLSVDDMLTCIPEAIKPGQIGYIYSYYHDIEDVDLSNGISFQPDGKTMEAEKFYEIDVSDESFSVGSFMDIKVIGRGANNTSDSHTFAKPGAIFFDSEDNVMGFCYGLESFDAGQTKAFEIQGDLLSADYNPKNVSRVEVYIQGNEW